MHLFDAYTAQAKQRDVKTCEKEYHKQRNQHRNTIVSHTVSEPAVYLATVVKRHTGCVTGS